MMYVGRLSLLLSLFLSAYAFNHASLGSFAFASADNGDGFDEEEEEQECDLSSLVGQDNSQNDNSKKEKSEVPGNWADACLDSSFNKASCKLSATCNFNHGKEKKTSQINLNSCPDGAEIRTLNGNLICWCQDEDGECGFSDIDSTDS